MRLLLFFSESMRTCISCKITDPNYEAKKRTFFLENILLECSKKYLYDVLFLMKI